MKNEKQLNVLRIGELLPNRGQECIRKVAKLAIPSSTIHRIRKIRSLGQERYNKSMKSCF